MTEITCPVCGRSNPETRDTCQTCGALLKESEMDIIGDRLASSPADGSDPSSTKKQATSDDQPSFPSQSQQKIPDENQDDQAGWLDMLSGDADPEDSGEVAGPDLSPPPAKYPEEKKPETDWLEKIKRLDKSSESVDEDSSFPDWLAVAGEPEEPAVEDEPQVEPSPEAEGDLPSWLQMDDEDELLNEFLKRKARQDEQYGIKSEIPEEEQEAQKPEPPPKFPSWASEEDRASAQQIPDELQFLAGEEQPSVDPFQMEEENGLDNLFDEDLPSWLTQASAEDVLPGGEEITPGELPGWVEAMRPVVESVDATSLDSDEEHIENYGPLAGIPGILPAEAETELDLEGRSKHNLDLIVTKTQQEYVNLLQKMIGAESKTKPLEKPAPIATQRMLRWLLSLILFIIIGAAIIFSGPASFEGSTPVPDSSAGYVSLFTIINELSAEDPVLIAFDYLPASAGEMNTASTAVVSHLMEKGVYLSLISTQPTGPALAENFIQTTQSAFNYLPNLQYINLGYLPGESAGLLSFVYAPKKILPLAYNGANAWGSPPLINVNRLADFKTILVITDDPNTAKNWIEQVEPYLLDTPLVMVISAQAEAILQPYYETNPQPLNGYAAGITDSLKYELLSNQPGRAHQIWLPFNLGIVIGASTIFISGLANGILALFTQHRTRQAGDH